MESRALLAGFVIPSEPLIPITSPFADALTVTKEGTSEVLTLTETNTSTVDARVNVGCGVADFWVTEGGVEVWRLSRDPRPLCPISNNGVLPAHQSRTFSATWDGHFNEAMPPDATGPFVYHASLDGVSVDSSELSAQPRLVVGITTDRAVYRVGRPVTITLTETNEGTEAAGVGVCGPSRVAISRQGVEVWQQPARGPCPALALLLPPGQSRQYTVIWPGRFNEHRGTPKAGLFLIQATLDGVSATATIRIEGDESAGPIR